jgi:hypothetical protein
MGFLPLILSKIKLRAEGPIFAISLRNVFADHEKRERAGIAQSV